MNDAPPNKAVATVNFNNFDEAVTIVLDLIKIKNDWRIVEVTSQRGGKTETLRGLFTH